MAQTKRNYGFQPGVSGNPNGRPRGSVHIDTRMLREQAKGEAIKAIAECLLMTKDEYKALIADPNATMVQIMTASVIDKAVKEGCMYRLQNLLNYIVGRPKAIETEGEEVEDEVKQQAQVLKRIPSSVLLEVVRRTQGDPAPGE